MSTANELERKMKYPNQMLQPIQIRRNKIMLNRNSSPDPIPKLMYDNGESAKESLVCRIDDVQKNNPIL